MHVDKPGGYKSQYSLLTFFLLQVIVVPWLRCVGIAIIVPSQVSCTSEGILPWVKSEEVHDT